MIEPKLRFKADDGSQFPEWEEKTIDEVAGGKTYADTGKEPSGSRSLARGYRKII